MAETVHHGSRGDAVTKLQHELAALAGATGNGHLDPGGSDGVFGDRTAAAVRAFQEMQHTTVDGIAGHQTWAALEAHRGARAALTWVRRPVIADSRIHYSYRNAGHAAAAIVQEDVIVDGTSVGSQAATPLAAGAEYNSMVFSALRDGNHKVTVRVYSSTDGANWDPTVVEGAVDVTVSGGWCYPPGHAQTSTAVPRIDGIDFERFVVVVHYIVETHERLQALNLWAQVGPNGADDYYNGTSLTALSGTARVEIPDNCHGQNLATQVLLRATTSAGTNVDTVVQVPVEVHDDGIHRTGDLVVVKSR